MQYNDCGFWSAVKSCSQLHANRASEKVINYAGLFPAFFRTDVAGRTAERSKVFMPLEARYLWFVVFTARNWQCAGLLRAAGNNLNRILLPYIYSES